jgi:hypothetical protein
MQQLNKKKARSSNNLLQRIAKSVTSFAKRLQNNRHFGQRAEQGVIEHSDPAN